MSGPRAARTVSAVIFHPIPQDGTITWDRLASVWGPWSSSSLSWIPGSRSGAKKLVFELWRCLKFVLEHLSISIHGWIIISLLKLDIWGVHFQTQPSGLEGTKVTNGRVFASSGGYMKRYQQLSPLQELAGGRQGLNQRLEHLIWGFPKSWGYPHSWMVSFMENPKINMDDLEVPPYDNYSQYNPLTA